MSYQKIFLGNCLRFSGPLKHHYEQILGKVIHLSFGAQCSVNKALQNLPEDIRVTLSLREFDGLSYEEIAKVLECPIGTVRSRIHKGREMLDPTLSKDDMSNFEARKFCMKL